jgi:hypothetical protein
VRGLHESESSKVFGRSALKGGKIVSPTHRPPLLSREDPWYSFLLEAVSTAGPQCDRKKKRWMRNVMTPSGMEPATFRPCSTVPQPAALSLFPIVNVAPSKHVWLSGHVLGYLDVTIVFLLLHCLPVWPVCSWRVGQSNCGLPDIQEKFTKPELLPPLLCSHVFPQVLFSRRDCRKIYFTGNNWL